MAIKVQNTEVISNTYGLKNITSIDSTTQTTIESVISAGAQGGGSNRVFWENDQQITNDYTITNNQNAGSFGPITINSGITVTVGAGEVWTVV
jgi:hypothetical protein